MLKPSKRRLPGESDRDSGFSMIEVIVALALLLFIMSSSVVFFVRSLQVSALQQQRQAATALGEQQLELAGNVAADDMLCLRTAAAVNAQWANAPTGSADLTSELATTTQDWDGRVGSQPCADSSTITAAPPLPATSTPSSIVVGKTTYKTQTYIGDCWYTTTAGVTSCIGSGPGVPTLPNATTTYVYRVIVAVWWTPSAGQTCSTGTTCYYVVETLRDWHSDPQYVKAG